MNDASHSLYSGELEVARVLLQCMQRFEVG